MDRFDPVAKAQEAAAKAVDDLTDYAQDVVQDAADEVTDRVQDAASDVVSGVTDAAVETVREWPVLLLLGALVALGLFLIMSLFAGGPVQFLERLILPVRFVIDNDGTGGDWYKVIFTDPPQAYDPNAFHSAVADELMRRINAAQKSIYIAAFDFDLTPVAQALIAAHNRGVDVRWFTDDENGLWDDGDPGGGQFAMLQAAGIPVRSDLREPLMHNKFIVFDDEAAWTGSTNLTVNGLFSNNNNVIIFEDKSVAQMYDREFDELWRGSSGASSNSTFFRQRVTLQGTPVEVLFAPEDNAVDRLVPLVKSAKHSIRFMAFAFTHDGLGEELVRQARRGVDVRGVFETRNTGDPASEIDRLGCNGLAVRKDGNPATMHHKVFIIDDKIVVTGSFNFSNSANNSNDENMVFLNNDTIAALYDAEFEKVWAEAWTPDPAEFVCR